MCLAAILIRVVKHVLTNDCFSPYLELQNGVLYHTIVIYTTFRGAPISPRSNFENSILEEKSLGQKMWVTKMHCH